MGHFCRCDWLHIEGASPSPQTIAFWYIVRPSLKVTKWPYLYYSNRRLTRRSIGLPACGASPPQRIAGYLTRSARTSPALGLRPPQQAPGWLQFVRYYRRPRNVGPHRPSGRKKGEHPSWLRHASRYHLISNIAFQLRFVYIRNSYHRAKYCRARCGRNMCVRRTVLRIVAGINHCTEGHIGGDQPLPVGARRNIFDGYGAHQLRVILNPSLNTYVPHTGGRRLQRAAD